MRTNYLHQNNFSFFKVTLNIKKPICGGEVWFFTFENKRTNSYKFRTNYLNKKNFSFQGWGGAGVMDVCGHANKLINI